MPGVTWIDDPAYAAAFADLIGETIMRPDCAAYTKPGQSYPGFINITRDHTGAFIFTMRADPFQVPHGDGTALQCGEVTVVTIPEDEFHQLFADANRLRVPNEAGEGQHDLDLDSDRSGGAAAGDPLNQRGAAAEEGGGFDDRITTGLAD